MNTNIYQLGRIYALVLILTLSISTPISALSSEEATAQSTESEYTFGGDCFRYEFLGASGEGPVTLSFRMWNLCDRALSHVAFSLPEGVVPESPEDGSTYDSPNEIQYDVESPTNNPFYSIKFETIGEGIRDGAEDIFEYTLPAGAYDPQQAIQIEAKGGRIKEIEIKVTPDGKVVKREVEDDDKDDDDDDDDDDHKHEHEDKDNDF